MLAVRMSLWLLARAGTIRPDLASVSAMVVVRLAAAIGYAYPVYVNVPVFP